MDHLHATILNESPEEREALYIWLGHVIAREKVSEELPRVPVLPKRVKLG